MQNTHGVALLKKAAEAARFALPDGNPDMWIAWIYEHYHPFDPELETTLIVGGLYVMLLSPNQLADWIQTCPVQSSCFPEFRMESAA